MSSVERLGGSPTSAKLLQQGVAAVREGRRGEARRCLQQALSLDPRNEEAWLWLAVITADPRAALAYFSQALDINPQNQRARDGFSVARARLAEIRPRPSAPSPAVRSAAPQATLAAVGDFFRSKVDSVAGRSLRGPSSGRLPHPGTGSGALLSRVNVVFFGWVALALLAILLIASGWATDLGQAAWDQWIATSTPTPTATPVPTPTPTNEQLKAPLWAKLHGAWDSQAWSYVIELLERIRDIDPANAEAEEKLFAAHFNFATQLVKEGQLQEAIAQFDHTLLLRPEYLPAQEGRDQAATYLEGVESHAQGNWSEAIDSLEKVYLRDYGYQEIGPLLYEAHWRQGAVLQESGHLSEALVEYRRALDIQPYGTEASTRRAQVTSLLKRIEVDVSEQRLTAWDGDKLVYSFVASTGKSGTPTRYGRFSIISKLPEAYGSAWDIRMPYWMGIYWAGGSENGIHGLPILSSGQTLWSGYLGQRVSYGCVVLDTWAAKQLYDWAEIGTEMIIYE